MEESHYEQETVDQFFSGVQEISDEFCRYRLPFWYRERQCSEFLITRYNDIRLSFFPV